MSTLYTEQIEYEIDYALVERQYNSAVNNNSDLKKQYPKALKLFKTGKHNFDNLILAKAMDCFSEILQLIWDQGINDLEAACFYYIGIMMLSSEMDNEGITSLKSALWKTQDYYLALSIFNLFSTYYLTKNDSETVHQYCDKSLEIAANLPDVLMVQYMVAAANYNKAEALVRENKHKDAIQFVKIADQSFSKISFIAESNKCKSLLGGILVVQNNFSDAQSLLDTACKFFEKENNKSELIDIYRFKGLSLIGLGDRKNGLKFLSNAVELCNETNDIKSLNIVLSELTKYS
jgi:tetratricopeptide (TPR) repeat protein